MGPPIGKLLEDQSSWLSLSRADEKNVRLPADGYNS